MKSTMSSKAYFTGKSCVLAVLRRQRGVAHSRRVAARVRQLLLWVLLLMRQSSCQQLRLLWYAADSEREIERAVVFHFCVLLASVGVHHSEHSML